MKLPLFLLSRIYNFGCLIKDFLYTLRILKPKTSQIKVISVGNISFGGTGKTPLAIEIIKFLLEKTKKVCLVSRGYRGKWEKNGGILSNGKKILGKWKESGDEPFLVAQNLPQAGVFVGRNRFESCQKAFRMGFEIAVLDDGFQHRKLHRDIDIVLLSESRDMFLREFPSSLRRADILLIKDNQESFYYDLSKIKNRSPQITTHSCGIIPDGVYSVEDNQPLPLDYFQDKKTLAFCGIAKPERFFSLLNELGINPAKTLIYPDHHLYPDSSLNQILETARREGLSAFITTEKDAVKIRQTRLSREHLFCYLKIVMKIQKDFFDSLWSKLENCRDKKA